MPYDKSLSIKSTLNCLVQLIRYVEYDLISKLVIWNILKTVYYNVTASISLIIFQLLLKSLVVICNMTNSGVLDLIQLKE